MNMLTVMESFEPRNVPTLDVASNVIPFLNAAGDPFSALTARMVVERFRRGDLPEAILLALMASVGLWP
jgi:hypothetical protein